MPAIRLSVLIAAVLLFLAASLDAATAPAAKKVQTPKKVLVKKPVTAKPLLKKPAAKKPAPKKAVVKPAPKKAAPKKPVLAKAVTAPPKRRVLKPNKNGVYPIVPVKHAPPLCNAIIGYNRQCGGTQRGPMGCDKYPFDLKVCQDAPYQQACCKTDWTCQRLTSVTWRCRPAKFEKAPALPPLSALPPKKDLPKPFYVKSKSKTNSHKYLLLKYDATWDVASAICQYYFGLHLASIHDIDEMWRVNNQCYFHMENMCWVGAHDRTQRGAFKWSDGSSWDFGFWQQHGGVMATPDARCIALQDGFQTWDCNEKFAIACQVY